MFSVHETYTLYGCQVAAERLSKAAVAERALQLGDEHGLEAITTRRLAQELGVTPMALYWHFKSKEELLLGIVDHALEGVRSGRDPETPWNVQLRAMVEALVDVLRRHPVLPDLMHACEKDQTPNFIRATNDALALLTQAGFDLQESFWVAIYLMNGAVNMVGADTECPPLVPADQVHEWRRQKRLTMESQPSDQYPLLIAFGRTFDAEPDPERYFEFGISLLVGAVESMAGSKARRL
jgi:AcrR family transcriptional regulator